MVAIKKKGLGRGLEALLGEKTQSEGSSTAINRLPLTALQAGKYQPRQKMAAGALQELAESIREQGVMQLHYALLANTFGQLLQCACCHFLSRLIFTRLQCRQR